MGRRVGSRNTGSTPAHVLAAHKARYATLKALGLCVDCRAPADDGPGTPAAARCPACVARHRVSQAATRARAAAVTADASTRAAAAARRAAELRLYRRLRAAALAAYGNRCACCWEWLPAALVIDHVGNDGAAERRAGRAGFALLRHLKAAGWPAAYQVLCATCNQAKGHTLAACPHTAADRRALRRANAGRRHRLTPADSQAA